MPHWSSTTIRVVTKWINPQLLALLELVVYLPSTNIIKLVVSTTLIKLSKGVNLDY